MLGVWAVLELILISLADLNFSLSGITIPEPAELIRSNGPLLPFALIYCALVLGTSTAKPTMDVVREGQPKQEDVDG